MSEEQDQPEPKWLTAPYVHALHDASLELFGGLAGVRDQGLLESALGKPRNLFAYGEPSLFQLAAAYCAGIVRNHPFLDGNKRAGLLAARAFLYLNGYQLDPEQGEAIRVIETLAAGQLNEEALAEWLEHNSQASPQQ